MNRNEGRERVRILLVDDSPTFLGMLRSVLSVRYEVTTCLDAFEALKCLDQQTYHVVCSDFVMPGMSGTELLKEVNRLPIATGCLLITGAPELVKALEIRKDNVCAVLPKPCDPDRLLRMVDQLVRLTTIHRQIDARGEQSPSYT